MSLLLFIAGIALINGLISEIMKQSREIVKEKYESLQEFHKQFEIFSRQNPGLGMRLKNQMK